MVNRDNIIIKTPGEIEIMSEGGKKLAFIKKQLLKFIREGRNAFEVDKLAEELILKQGGFPSFKLVPNYHWATCVNKNDGIVHGIPTKDVVFRKGDLISVDLGMFYHEFNTDTSFTILMGEDQDKVKFLNAGKEALKEAIYSTKVGNRIFDISFAIETVIKKFGYFPVKALVGHGVGRKLHEEPQIPCFVGNIIRENSSEIFEGMVFAIEVIYALGSGDIRLKDDGWTIVSSDGKISALLEETVAVTSKGPKVLTNLDL